MFERELRDMAHVNRWGILRRNRNQNICEHMYYVAIYSVQIADTLGLDLDRASLMKLALTHDVDELWTGDIPAPAKHEVVNIGAMNKLTNSASNRVFGNPYGPLGSPFDTENIGMRNTVKVIKIADLMDAVLYLCDEYNSGNKSVGLIEDNSTALGANFEALINTIRMSNFENIVELEAKVRIAVVEHMEGHSKIFLRST